MVNYIDITNDADRFKPEEVGHHKLLLFMLTQQ